MKLVIFFLGAVKQLDCTPSSFSPKKREQHFKTLLQLDYKPQSAISHRIPVTFRVNNPVFIKDRATESQISTSHNSDTNMENTSIA